MTNDNKNTKKLFYKLSPQEHHWVGDGFYVSTIFSMSPKVYPMTTPFLLMDHADAKEFTPSNQSRGVGEHPHRGFETVTFAIHGEIEHRDSGGGGGRIGTGGVQWMTAASGVVHEEMHSKDFSEKGGVFEMVQLWVNLPAKDKMNPPRYQSINLEEMPEIALAEGKVKACLVAGELEGAKGPAKTHTPMQIYRMSTEKDSARVPLKTAEGWNQLLFVLRGEMKFEGSSFATRDLAILTREGSEVEIELAADSELLVLTGEPIDEPIAAYGPFVMNTEDEIRQAIKDFQAGKMGRLVEEV